MAHAEVRERRACVGVLFVEMKVALEVLLRHPQAHLRAQLLVKKKSLHPARELQEVIDAQFIAA